MRWLLLLLVLFAGCKPETAEERQRRVEADLQEIDRLQQKRFKYEAEQKAAQDSLEMREAINKAKANSK